MAAAIGAACECVCFTICLGCFHKSIKLAIDIVDASADFIMVTKRILIIPFLYFLLSIFVVFTWFPGYILVTSLNHIEASKYLPQVREVFWTSETIPYAIVMWLGLVWALMVVDYAKNFIVLFSASTYYFNSPAYDKDEDGNEIEGSKRDGSAEVCLGVKLAHVKHLGSIAFGALIIAILKIIRFIFVTVAKQALKASGQEDSPWGKLAKCFIACGDCILKCLEKICDYINNIAYAYMAITGKNFCSSAWDGFMINVKNAGTFGAAKFMATALIFLGKLAITMLNVYTCYVLIGAMLGQNVSKDAPCVVVGILTWFSTQVWLTIFDQAILGIMMSYAVDFELTGGEPCRGPETFDNKRKKFEEGHEEMKKSKEALQA
jgi:hypothetical protein